MVAEADQHGHARQEVTIGDFNMIVVRSLFYKLIGWVVLPVLMWTVVIYLIIDIYKGLST